MKKGGIFLKNAIQAETCLGTFLIAEENGAVTDILHETDADFIRKETPLLEKARDQLLEYLAGTRRAFDLPLSPSGTEFQKAVWKALTEIPYGETRSYGDIARAVGRPKACRAVGMANHRNPLLIAVPCHRVIGADGSLTGYGGGMEMKRKLLALEQGFPLE